MIGIQNPSSTDKEFGKHSVESRIQDSNCFGFPYTVRSFDYYPYRSVTPSQPKDSNSTGYTNPELHTMSNNKKKIYMAMTLL